MKTLLSLALLQSAVVFAGAISSGGGDLWRVTERALPLTEKLSARKVSKIRNYIEAELKDEVLALFRRSGAYQAELAAAGNFFSAREQLKIEAFRQHVERRAYVKRFRFAEDVRLSPYRSVESPLYACGKARDKKEKDASTCGRPGAEIQFNVNRLARYDLPWKSLRRYLVQLVFHEHARHLGIDDEEHTIAKIMGGEHTERELVRELSERSSKLNVYRAQLILQKTVAKICGRSGSFGVVGAYVVKTADGIEIPNLNYGDVKLERSFALSSASCTRSTLSQYLELGLRAEGFSLEKNSYRFYTDFFLPHQSFRQIAEAIVTLSVRK